MAEFEDIAAIKITEPLPESGFIGMTYKIEGTVKILEAVGAPPWVYAEVKRKKLLGEEVSYERGFPVPITGEFSIDLKLEKGDYEVTVVATPAPLSLPVVGMVPITGRSDTMKISVEELVPEFTNLKIAAYAKV